MWLKKKNSKAHHKHREAGEKLTSLYKEMDFLIIAQKHIKIFLKWQKDRIAFYIGGSHYHNMHNLSH